MCSLNLLNAHVNLSYSTKYTQLLCCLVDKDFHTVTNGIAIF